MATHFHEQYALIFLLNLYLIRSSKLPFSRLFELADKAGDTKKLLFVLFVFECIVPELLWFSMSLAKWLPCCCCCI